MERKKRTYQVKVPKTTKKNPKINQANYGRKKIERQIL